MNEQGTNMGTPQRQWKHLERRLRKIPVEQIASSVAAFEREGRGLWCIVAGELVFVTANSNTETTWDDELGYAQIDRYVRSQPGRVHPTLESAREFVRSQPS